MVGVNQVDPVPLDDLGQSAEGPDLIQRIEALKGQPVLSQSAGRQQIHVASAAGSDEEDLVSAAGKLLNQLKRMGFRAAGPASAPRVRKKK